MGEGAVFEPELVGVLADQVEEVGVGVGVRVGLG